MARPNLRRRLVTASYPVIRGSGGSKGGSGAGRVAQEDPDSLVSRQYAKLIEAISEGEIAGFFDPDHPLRCIALDGTPVENSDDSLNFHDFQVFFLPGTNEQSYLPGFDAAANVTAEGVKVTTTTPWTKRFTTEAIDAIRIDVRFPRLQKQNTTNGDVTGTEVNLLIYIKESANDIGSVFVLVVNDIIRGKASNPYVRSYQINLGGIQAPWDIRVVRVTSDHDETQSIQDDTYIESYSEITYGKLRYPNTAVIGVAINAEQFGNIPSRAYRMKGRIIRVPTNYDPVTRLYATTGPGTTNGTWDGTFKLAYSNNPAWCYYDMATHKRYGLGNFLDDSQVNKFALYPIAQYCDANNARPSGTTNDYGPDGKHGIPDGNGGFEPRFMCNLFLQKREDAMKVLTDMTTIFRGMHYFAEGALQPFQDKPRTPDIQIGPANVISGVFNYSGTGRKARHTAALVSWNDQSNYSKLTPEPYEDADAILKYGYNPIFITNLGCSSQMCARRTGKWALTAERILTDALAFQMGAEGFDLRPGIIAQISDPMRDGADWSGRIKARTSTTLTLDFQVNLEAINAPYRLYVTVYDLAAEANKVVSVEITNAAGPTSVLTFAPWPGAIQMPDVGTLWQIASTNVEPELFRILNVTPKDEATSDVTALQYRDDLYDFIDVDAALDPPGPNPLPNPNYVIPIKPKIFTDGISTANSFVFGSAANRFEQNWLGHRITAPGISAAIVESVESPTALTLSERTLITDPTTTYEFSAIGVKIVALIDLVQGVTRDLHIGWLESEDRWKRGYICAYRYENGNWVNRPESAGTETIIENVIPGIYELSVVVVNRWGKFSTPVLLSVAVAIDNPLEGAIISGLEITGQGNDTTFSGRDVQFDWRVNSPSGADITPDDDANQDSMFRSYVATIYQVDIATGSDLSISASSANKVRNTARGWTEDDVNAWIQIRSGTGFTTGWYQILELDGDAAVLDRDAGTLSSVGGGWRLRLTNSDEDVIQESVDNILHPTYTFTFQNNAACPGRNGYGFHTFKIGIKIRDRFDNESDEAYITVSKRKPLPPIEPCNLVPTIGGVDPSWTNQPDISRAKTNIFKNRAPSVTPHFSSKMANAAAADATHVSITGLTDELVSMWAEAEDVFGLRSTVEGQVSSALFLGTAAPGRVNDVAQVTFMPDGGLAPADNRIHAAHPDSAAQIWYRENDDVTPITNNPADGSALYDDGTGIAITSTAHLITARAYVNGLWSEPFSRTFEKNGGTGDVCIAPSFNPPGGTHSDPSGELPVLPESSGADYIFYTLTNDGSTPDMPTHDGSTPPEPTGDTLRIAEGELIILERGINKIAAIAQKAGLTDSSRSDATYHVIQSGGGTP